MRASIITLLATALIIASGTTEGSTQKPKGSQPSATRTIDRSRAGQVAPSVVLEARGGAKRRLSGYAGKPVLVNLWATWCAPCIAEMPALDRLAAASKGRLTVIPVSQDLEGWRAVDGFFRPGRFKVLTPLLDQPNDLALALGAKGLPMTILYDARGREVWRINGPMEWDSPAAAKLIGL